MVHFDVYFEFYTRFDVNVGNLISIVFSARKKKKKMKINTHKKMEFIVWLSMVRILDRIAPSYTFFLIFQVAICEKKIEEKV